MNSSFEREFCVPMDACFPNAVPDWKEIDENGR